MATSTAQDRAFLSELINDRLLEEAIYWINSNMQPDDVFSEEELENWADRHGYLPLGSQLASY